MKKYKCNSCFKMMKYSNCVSCDMIKSHLTIEEFNIYIEENRSKVDGTLQKEKKRIREREYRKERRIALLEALNDKRISISGIVYDKVHCTSCRNIKLRYKKQGDNKRIYRDEFDKKWEGRKCPNCYKNKQKEDSKKLNKYYEEKQCVICSTVFKPRAIDNIYCSKKCWPINQKIIK